MKINILCVGNSLLHHTPCADVFWDGDWGMAASCAENDYYHMLVQRLVKKYSNVDFTFRKNGSSSFERAITKSDTEDYTEVFDNLFGSSLEAMTPDIVTLQMGDNCPHESTTDTAYAHAIVEAVEYFKENNPNVVVVLCLPWYGEMIDSKHIGTLIAARETMMPFVDLTKLFCCENQARGLFKHDGVQTHPGDEGMEKIADEYFNALSKIIDKIIKSI